MNLQNFTPNWFDLVVLALLVVGLLRGRKRGMSEELLDVLKWLLMVVVSAMLYKPLGRFISSYLNVQLLFAYLFSYGFVLIVIYVLFILVKKAVGEKLVGSDIFGRMEYYLGMGAGMLRYFCMLLVGLAFINSYYISEAELKADEKKRRDSYGSAAPFPSFGSIQSDILRTSSLGPMICKSLGDQLIESTAYIDITKKREGFGKRMENDVNAAIDDMEKKKK